ncbi:hypothetical protein [Thalassomonas sp. M1454]|uniref:hypothetical protein n=1 Tax=Thalassomonas sp. M1454 TaxID=2594477 RepID=UPI00117DB158|nr:hypothetical protein [Thalassomonas sp. M1454]TRX57067.1 hypothetical protein FNN08_06090 [Thalassomonas sp. M1454]
MNANQEIHRIACQLAAENKTPSVALIKAKLSNNTPLAAIIKGLQYWQNNPEPQKIDTPKEKPVVEDKSGFVTVAQMELAIKNAISPLQAEIASLKQQLK